MIDVDGFSMSSLRTLLACQEYPEGTLALKIEAELIWRRGRKYPA